MDPDGRGEQLRQASRSYGRKHYAANREAINARRRAKYRSNPKPVIERTAAWNKANPEKRKEIRKRYYDAHREELSERYKAWAKANPDKAQAAHRRNKAIINEAKDHPCLDCGIQYPVYVMQFDHRDPATKSFTIGTKGPRKSPETLLAEIAKCDIVCANCHMERSYGNGTDFAVSTGRSGAEVRWQNDSREAIEDVA